jgi:pimeloyl-ACP methyl ester carboxylesterase
VLGYQRFGAQGGDWGSFITSLLGLRHAGKLTGIHLNMMPVRRDSKQPNPSADEARYLQEVRTFLHEETGYQWIQGTRPQTLAAALVDSPVGLAAWIVEKFHRWTDCGGTIESAIDRDRMLANISLYWFTGAIGASFWPYYVRLHSPWPIPEDGSIRVPTGYCEFPREILKPPRSLAERSFADIRRWSVMPRGGHFAAMEQPQALATEITEFFRPLRAG